MKTFICFFFLCLFVTSCSHKNQEKEIISVLPNKQINVDSLLQKRFNSISNSMVFANAEWVKQVYHENNFKSIWIDNNLKISRLGDSVLNVLQKANYFGLESNDYKSDELQSLKREMKKAKTEENLFKNALNLEVLLTDKMLLFAKHLNYGKIQNTDSLSILKRKPQKISIPKSFVQAVKKKEVLDFFEIIQPKQKEYQSLRLAVQKFVQTSNLSKDKVYVQNFKEDSIRSYEQAKNALILHQYIAKKASNSKLINALKEFQIDHGLTPDGLIGKNTANALSKSPYEYYQNAAVSLERWRWKPDWESSYIYINIPEYGLNYYKNDTLKLNSKVVLGGNYHKTPEIYSRISYLVSYPFWNVPQSISVNEIMVKAKKDTLYMRKNEFEVFTKRRIKIPLNEIRWDTLNSNNFNYYIRQKGGSSNALGYVKFIFPNDFSIYLHDTPTKYYFNRDIRNYSHGCIRVEKAMQLADTLLKNDHNAYNLDSVKSYILKQKEKKMMFTQKLPIYLQYITCSVNQNNRLIFYKDIYGYDDKIRKILFE